jgi:hypothetical protein
MLGAGSGTEGVLGPVGADALARPASRLEATPSNLRLRVGVLVRTHSRTPAHPDVTPCCHRFMR